MKITLTLIRKTARLHYLVLALFMSVSSSAGQALAVSDSFYIGNDIYVYDKTTNACLSGSQSTVSNTVVPTSGAAVNITMASANIQYPNGKYSLSQRERYRSVMDDFFIPNGVDFVTVQEQSPGTDLDYGDYKSFKRNYPDAKTTEDTGVRIVWNAKDWNRISGGIKQIHPYNERPANNRDRYALWANFQNITTKAVVSVIATHWNTGSQNSPKRSNIQGENLKTLAQELMPKGPVLIGGDFNYPYSEGDKDYSPKSILGQIGLKSAFQQGEGTNIDWLFYSPQLQIDTEAKGKGTQVFPKSGDFIVNKAGERVSDHPFVLAKFKGTSGGIGEDSGTMPVSDVSGGGGCVCPESGGTLAGANNAERVFNYFIGKGLSATQTAGIMGNMSVESGFDPENVQNGTADAKKYGERTKDPTPLTAGWGLIQWTPGSKVIKAGADAGVGNRPIHELATQLDIVWGHLQNKPPITKGSFSVPEFQKITDVQEAVNYFEDKIEGAGKPNYTDRYAAAGLALEQFGGKSSPSASTAGASSGSANCGGNSELVSGGMNLSQAQSFMKAYKDLAIKYANKRGVFTIPEHNVKVYGSGCSGSGLANCSSFSEFFVGKYTTGNQAFPDGKEMVGALLATKSGFTDGGSSPKTYAVFSRQSGGGGAGHTGVVLGMDVAAGKMIIGEASCGAGVNGITAKEVSISEFSSNDYSYAYTDDILKKGSSLAI